MMMGKKRDNCGKNKTECFGSSNGSSFYNAELKLLDKVHETKGFLVCNSMVSSLYVVEDFFGGWGD